MNWENYKNWLEANILEKTANYDKEDTLVFHPDAAARYGIEGHEQTFIDFYKSCQDYEDNERNYEITEEDKKYYNFSEGIEKKRKEPENDDGYTVTHDNLSLNFENKKWDEMFPNRAKTFFQLYDEKTRKYEEKSATPEQYQALGKAFNLYITEAETTQKLGNIFDNQIKTEQGDSVIGWTFFKNSIPFILNKRGVGEKELKEWLGKYELLGHEEREKLEEQEQQVSIALFLVQEQGKKASLAKQREENLKFYGNLGIFLLVCLVLIALTNLLFSVVNYWKGKNKKEGEEK